MIFIRYYTHTHTHTQPGFLLTKTDYQQFTKRAISGQLYMEKPLKFDRLVYRSGTPQARHTLSLVLEGERWSGLID